MCCRNVYSRPGSLFGLTLLGPTCRLQGLDAIKLLCAGATFASIHEPTNVPVIRSSAKCSCPKPVYVIQLGRWKNQYAAVLVAHGER